LSLIGIERTLHGAVLSRTWLIVFGIAWVVLVYGVLILYLVLRRIELRRQSRLGSTSIPELAAWVKIGASKGWIYARNGLLIFESTDFCFMLSIDCFARPDRILKDVASDTPLKLLKADGLPQIKLKVRPLMDQRDTWKSVPMKRLRQVIMSLQEQGNSHDKPLYPPILLKVPEDSVLESIWKAVSRSIAFCIPTGVIYAYFVTQVPTEIWPNHSSAWLQGLMISILLLMLIGPIAACEVYDNWFRHKRYDDVQKCIETYGSREGETVVPLTE
jgi:hypothetical protein